jgi:hypothetical protein
MIEPWITPFSRLIYTYLHQEECDLNIQPWQMEQAQFDTGKNAFDGNAAIPYTLLEQGQATLTQQLPELRLKNIERFSSLTYLLSGGFKPMSLLPAALYSTLYHLEETTRPLWNSVLALRALILWEKIGD